MFEIKEEGAALRLTGDEPFSLRHTFECGQCFRWKADGRGDYTGVAGGRAVRVWEDGGHVMLGCNRDEYEGFWRDYFDLERSYSQIAEGLPQDDFTKSAVSYGMGLRILRQEPWEALCSFIISQCNNIPRIQKIVDTLCEAYGDDVTLDGERLKTFPSAERLANLPEDGLDMLRAGYRAPYILNAARRVADGEIDFKTIDALDTPDAEKYIMGLNGVGRKVADCFLLFGMGKLDAFPVDTWMKKAAPYYKDGFDSRAFGKYAGIAQQYIFYYAREKKIGNEK